MLKWYAKRPSLTLTRKNKLDLKSRKRRKNTLCYLSSFIFFFLGWSGYTDRFEEQEGQALLPNWRVLESISAWEGGSVHAHIQLCTLDSWHHRKQLASKCSLLISRKYYQFLISDLKWFLFLSKCILFLYNLMFL